MSSTDRATHLIDVWISNDSAHYFEARELAAEGHDAMEQYLREVLRTAPEGSTAWHVLGDLLALVDWRQIAKDLKPETQWRWNQHKDDAGNWCLWSSVSVAESVRWAMEADPDDDSVSCPAGCARSAPVEETDD